MKEVLRAVYQKDYRRLEELLGLPENVNAADEDGRSPLMHAVLAEDADPAMVRFLINHGARLDATEKGGWTALHFAARDQKKDIVRTLLDSGASVDALDAFGDTPLWRAVMNFGGNLEIVKTLLKHGADPKKKNSSGVSPIDLARKSGETGALALLESK